MKEITEEQKERLKSLISDIPSGWRDKAIFRRENRYWIVYSSAIALQILISEKYKTNTKEYLSECLGLDLYDFDKYLHGEYNFTLKEIANIENVFEIKINL